MSRILIGSLALTFLCNGQCAVAETLLDADKNPLGIAAYRSHRFDEAEKIFSEAIRLEESAHGQSELLATYLTNISLVFDVMGRKAEAEQAKIRAQKITAALRGLPDPEEVAKKAVAEAQFRETEQKLKNRISTEEQAHHRKAAAQALQDLVVFYRDAGKYAQAETTTQRILSMVKQDAGSERDRLYASLLRDHASLLTKLGRNEEAQQQKHQAEQLDKQAKELDASFLLDEERLKNAFRVAQTKPSSTSSIVSSFVQLASLYKKRPNSRTIQNLKALFEETINALEKLPSSLDKENSLIQLLAGYADFLQSDGDAVNSKRYREKADNLKQQVAMRTLAKQQASHSAALQALNKGGSCGISGKIWLSFKSGDSKIQRGKEVVLCDDGILNELRRPGEMGILPLRRYMLGPLPELVQKHLLKSSESDADGQYSFTNIPSGRYCLLSIAYSDEYSAYWAVPISVNKQENVDLRNSNLYDMIGY